MNLDADILNLLDEMGEELTLVKASTGAYDPATSSATETTTTYPIITAIIGYKSNYVDGTKIQSGDRKAIIAAKTLSVSPDIGDKITGLGGTVRIIDMRTVRKSGVNVAYVCQVRE